MNRRSTLTLASLAMLTLSGARLHAQDAQPGWRAATPEEEREAWDMVEQYFDQQARRMPAQQFAEVLATRWRKLPGAEFGSAANFRYHVVEAVGPEALPRDAKSRGIKASAGLGVKTGGMPFEEALVMYSIFDDPERARRYFDDLDHNLNDQVQRLYRTYVVEKKGYAPVTLRCVYVPGTQDSVNCHFIGARGRVVAVLSGAAIKYLEDAY